MPNTNQFARGASAFMQGFSFVDNINHRKRQEAKLDQRLEEEAKDREFMRQRLSQIDAERGADRATAILDRDRNLSRQDRVLEGNALAADVNTPIEVLQKYADVPSVAVVLRQLGLEGQERADLELITAPGLNQQATGTPPGPVTEQPGDEGLNGQVTAAEIPPDEFAAAASAARATSRDLNDIADADPQEAMAIRDAQNTVPSGEVSSDNPLGIPTVGAESRADNKSKKAQINAEWELFLDIENVSGDAIRNIEPSVLTAKYFDDRSNIDNPEVQDNVDRRMRPVITQTIETQQEALVNAVEPIDVRNASRKLSEAYGLANEIGIQYSVLDGAGVDARGYPVGTANQNLSDNFEDTVKDGPGTSLPVDPSTTQADINMVNRGVSGSRMNERFALASYRLYKGGRINWEQYKSLRDTGKLPGAVPVFSQTDPKKDTWATYPDGTRVLVTPARDPDKDTSGRNLIDDDGLKQLNMVAKAYDTTDDPTRGTRLISSFQAAIASNENRARQLGYDFSNVNDTVSLFQRWTQLHVVRDAYNDEWSHNGDAFPDFTEDYGSLPDALFNRDVDDLDRKSIAGFFQDADPLDPLKDRDPRVYESVRRGAPEFANSTDEEIEVALREQGL